MTAASRIATDWTATAIADGVRSGRLTAVDAVTESLRRIAERDADIGAFQVVRHDRALAEAAAVDARADRADLPLAGVPVAVKDNVSVEGEPMRDGSAATSALPQSADHPVVARLRAAGAVVVGITRVPELCVYAATDSVFGITRNPWLLSRTPGGSSGGSGAAVAAGMVPVAHGNDGMGSVRIPASCCGLVGIKPGPGVVPAGIGANDWYGMAENGVLATTAADASLTLSVMAGRPELADAGLFGDAAPADAGRGARIPGDLAVAVSTRPPIAGVRVDPEYVRATFAVATALARAGHRIERQDPPYPQSTALAAMVRWFAGAAADAEHLDGNLLEHRVRVHAGIGRTVRRTPLMSDALRDSGRRRLLDFLQRHDVVLTPGLAQPPIAAEAWGRGPWWRTMLANTRFAPFAAPWNIVGFPSIAIPAGVHDSVGTPLAVLATAAPGREALLLSVAAQVERLLPWSRTAPGY